MAVCGRRGARLLVGLALLGAALAVAAADKKNVLSADVSFDVHSCAVRFPALWGEVSNPNGLDAKDSRLQGPAFRDQYAAASVIGRAFLKCRHQPNPRPDYGDYGSGYRRSLLANTTAGPAAAAAGPALNSTELSRAKIEQIVAEALAKTMADANRDLARDPNDFDAICDWDGTTDTRVLFDPFANSNAATDSGHNNWMASIKWNCRFVSDRAASRCNRQFKKDTVVGGQGRVQIKYAYTGTPTVAGPPAQFDPNSPADKGRFSVSTDTDLALTRDESTPHLVTGFFNGEAAADEEFKPLRRFNVGLSKFSLADCANANWKRFEGDTATNNAQPNPPWRKDVFYNELDQKTISAGGNWEFDLTI